jgi:hypothetical protein
VYAFIIARLRSTSCPLILMSPTERDEAVPVTVLALFPRRHPDVVLHRGLIFQSSLMADGDVVRVITDVRDVVRTARLKHRE